MDLFVGFKICEVNSGDTEEKNDAFFHRYEKLKNKYGSDIIHCVHKLICCSTEYYVLIVGYNVDNMSFDKVKELDTEKIKKIKKKLELKKKIKIISA